VGDLGAVLGIDNDAATLVDLEADIFKAETSGVRTATDSYKYDIGIELNAGG